MAFNPSSTIYLCNVDFDSSYKNIRFFENATAQRQYFNGKVVKTLSEYTTVREALPDGGTRSKLRVAMNIDSVRALPCNYMFYQNANHGSRMFFAFIVDLIYKNEGTTEIVFETDVWQTWQFDITILDSYVEREHSVTDGYFDNTVPEAFNFQNYSYEKAADSPLGNWGYLIAASERLTGEDSTDEGLVTRGRAMSGIYQGLYFYYFTGETVTSKINSLLDSLDANGLEAVQFITLVPQFNLGLSGVFDDGYVQSTLNPAERTIYINNFIDNGLTKFGSYEPKNRKLFTFPFFSLCVSNHNGEQAEYRVEDFADRSSIQFKMYGDISANPSVTLIPKDYKGLELDYDNGISITGFPQCSFNSDTYKLWVAKNQFGMGVSALANGAQIIGGVASIATGAGAVAGASMIASGVTGVLGTINNSIQASKEPNRITIGGNKTNLLTAIKQNNFVLTYRKIKQSDAETIDNFFTMYGYQTNRIKKPNLKSRPFFNYVKCVGVNIRGGIPMDDMARIKMIFDNGVTLWKSGAAVGDYSVNNSPS